LGSEPAVLADRLTALGLRAAEAKAYLAAVKLGPSTAMQIARESQLERTEIYRLMQRLVSLGLVEENIERPRRYRPSTLREAMRLLAEKTLKQAKAAAQGVEGLVAELEALRSVTGDRFEAEVRIITGIRNMQRDFLKSLADAQNEVWMMTGGKQLPYVLRHALTDALAIIASKHVRARVIIDADQDELRRITRLGPLIEVRHYEPVRVHLYGVDNRSVSMGLTFPTQENLDEASELLVTHRSYVEAVLDFFNSVWRQATPIAARIGALQQGHLGLDKRTRVIWGREKIYAQLMDDYRRVKERIAMITTRHGPARILGRAKETFLEARERGVRVYVICNICRENMAAVKKLSRIAEIRHNDLANSASMSIALIDQSKAVIHYVQPDTPDLDSPADITILTTSQASIRDLDQTFSLFWENSSPLETRLQQLARKQHEIKVSQHAE